MFKKLLVPLDQSSLAEQALGQAAAIARASNAEVHLTMVHQPLPFGGFGDAPWNAEQWDGEHQYLETVADELASGASVRTSHAMLRGSTVELICTHAHDVGADLIVMTSHGRTGLRRAWLGSVADAVIRGSSIPVLLLRPVEGKTDRLATRHLFSRMLIPLDGSAVAAEVLSSALALSRCGGASVTLLRIVQRVPLINVDATLPYVYPPTIPDDVLTDRLADEARQQLNEMARRVAEESNLKVDAQVVIADHVAEGILDFARRQRVDVIAMSTHGRGTSRILLGSVADKVLRASHLPMLLYRPVGTANAGDSPEAAGDQNTTPMAHA